MSSSRRRPWCLVSRGYLSLCAVYLYSFGWLTEDGSGRSAMSGLDYLDGVCRALERDGRESCVSKELNRSRSRSGCRVGLAGPPNPPKVKFLCASSRRSILLASSL